MATASVRRLTISRPTARVHFYGGEVVLSGPVSRIAAKTRLKVKTRPLETTRSKTDRHVTSQASTHAAPCWLVPRGKAARARQDRH